VLNDQVEVPVLVGEPREILRGIRPEPAALTFQTRGIGHPRDVSLIPITASRTSATTSTGKWSEVTAQ
jgi:hypothetical protein